MYRKIPFADLAGQEASTGDGDAKTLNSQVAASLRAVVWRLASCKGRVPAAHLYQCLVLSLYTPNSLEVAYLLSTLGCQLISVGMHREAEQVHRRALCIAAAKLGPSHPELSYCLDWLGLSLYLQGQFTEALLVCYATKEMVEKSLGEKHPNVCGCLLNMAAVYDAMGWFLYAWHMREQALLLYASLQQNNEEQE